MAERIRLFAEHHIVAVRTQRRTGEIVAVKHLAWGWISPKQYYLMQEIHRTLPDVLSKVIEGGYRLKQAIWGWEIDLEVLATGVKLPAGLAIIGATLALAGADASSGHQPEAFIDIISLFLPFGELWLLYRGIIGVEAAGKNIAAGVEFGSVAGGLAAFAASLPQPFQAFVQIFYGW